MELKECVDKINATKGHWKGLFFWDYRQELETMISFCETALKLQGEGMPKKKEECYSHGNMVMGQEWNSCHDAWTAWLASRVSKKQMIKIINKIQVDVPEIGRIWKDTFHPDLTRELSEAIVASILGKE